MKSRHVVAILTVIALVVTAALTLDWSSFKAASESSEEESVAWPHYFNLDLQDDDNEENDFNFGPSAYDEEKSAEEHDAEHRERMKQDPMLGAANMAWFDANLGTRYLGEFYESCKGDWAKTMNAAKEWFAENPEAYAKVLDSFFKYLDKAKVEIRECEDVTDQMYANPYTADGVPDIIVMETLDHTGHELVYTFKVKDNTFMVAYRLECGFQPTNVAKLMGITPEKKPTTPTNPTPTNPTPDPDPDPDPTPTPTPTPDPDPTPKPKDPEDAPKTNTEPNDDPGPGPDTNNPTDPNRSTKDEDTNSNHLPSYEEYEEQMKELEEVNQSQKVGGDANTPTVTPPKGTTVDDNSSSGNGNGGIDVPTPTKPVAQEASGDDINSTPGEAWGGPPD